MKKGVEYTGVVTKIAFPNKGEVDCGEDGIASVKGTLPGQKVKFVVSKKRSGKAQGRLKEIIEKSPMEDVEPNCPHFGDCGGCSYQTMSYENQLKLKEDMVKGILDNAIKGDYQFEGILGSPVQWGYRNKMEFSFGDEFKDGPLALGMHKKNSFHDIVTVDNCKIVDRDYNIILRCVLDYCAKKELPFYHKLRHEGYVRHLLVRRTTKTKELLVALVGNDAAHHVLLDKAEVVAELVRVDGELVIGLHVHEIVEFAVVVQVLHLAGFQTHGVELRAGVERVVDHATGLDVAKLRADEGAALAGLDMLELDDGAHLAVVDDAHSVLEIGGRDSHW